MEYEIVQMVESDIDDVIELLKVCKLYYPEDDTRENFERKLGGDKDLMIVARVGGKIVGFIMASYDGWVAILWHLGVLPDYQRNGIARALKEEIKVRLKKRGASHVHALVVKDNSRMRTIFSNWKFQRGADVVVVSQKL